MSCGDRLIVIAAFLLIEASLKRFPMYAVASPRRLSTKPSSLGSAVTRNNLAMAFVPPARHLLRARDLADARYPDDLTVDDLAAAAGLSKAHFSREFRKTFGESPHGYLLARRLQRAA